MPILTPHDSAILASLFNSDPPAPAPTASTKAVHPSPTSLPNFSDSLLHILQTKESHTLAPLAADHPSEPTIRAAIAELSALISAYPTYPSAYNNRAQALVLLHGADLAVPAAGESGMYDDLSRCIRLCVPAASSQPSELQASILSKALTQRGYILLRTAKSLRQHHIDGTAGEVRLPGGLEGRTADELEGMARRDFKEGKGQGGEVAGVMDVKMNPVRKLCGEIVKEAMMRDLKESGVIPEYEV